MPGVCIAQVENVDLIEQIMEYISENLSEDQDYSEITDRLNFYRKYPMDINKAKKEQLEELVFISPIQINNLILHRHLLKGNTKSYGINMENTRLLIANLILYVD